MPLSVQYASAIGNQCESCKQLLSVLIAGLLQNPGEGGVHVFVTTHSSSLVSAELSQ
jgi:hypothetical protein